MDAAPAPLLDRRRFLTAGIGLGGLVLSSGSERSLAQEKPLPDRLGPDKVGGPPVVSARGWAVVEGRTGRLLWGGREATELVMASTTKVMTAYVVLRLAADNPKTLDEPMLISGLAAKTVGSSAQIRAGDRLSVRELLFGLLLPSGNDAATALAEHFGPRLRIPGEKTPPVDAFVAEMNRHAKSLRLAETRFFDPHGLGKNHTSARDLAMLAHHAMRDATFRDYVGTRRHRCEINGAKDERRTLIWNNTNRLLDIEGYDGIKTGTTTAAGSCLVASGRRGKDHLIIALLGATSNDSRYVDTRNLFRWAWRERGHKDDAGAR